MSDDECAVDEVFLNITVQLALVFGVCVNAENLGGSSFPLGADQVLESVHASKPDTILQATEAISYTLSIIELSVVLSNIFFT